MTRQTKTFADWFWARHANPLSGWTRVLSMPLIGIGLYLQDFRILGLSALWLIVNPFLFPAPRNIRNWMSRGTLGEQLYYRDGRKLKRDLPTLLNLLNIPAFAVFLWFGWCQELVPLILSGLLVMVLKFWFLDRMAHLALDSENESREQVRNSTSVEIPLISTNDS